MVEKMQRIFVDMDGTLAEWDTKSSIEEVSAKGYMLNRPAMWNMVNAVRILAGRGDYITCILSSVFHDDAAKEKEQWIQKHLPEISHENMYFCKYGDNKSDFVSATTDDVLIDDFTYNLKKWKGKGIKVYNGINGTHGTWNGYSVHSNCEESKLYAQLDAIIRLDSSF